MAKENENAFPVSYALPLLFFLFNFYFLKDMFALHSAHKYNSGLLYKRPQMQRNCLCADKKAD